MSEQDDQFPEFTDAEREEGFLEECAEMDREQLIRYGLFWYNASYRWSAWASAIAVDPPNAHLGHEGQRQQIAERLRTAEHHLKNLLARVHRDGGHYVAEHGLEKAVEDADTLLAELLVK